MKPTDQVDDLLQRAGAQWRADQPPAVEPDFDRITGGKRTAKRWTASRWVPLAAAASVAAVVAGALVTLPGDGETPTAVPPVPESAGTVITEQGHPARSSTGPRVIGRNRAGQFAPVRSGDKVEVDGQILAAPGKEPIFCAPLMVPARHYPPGQEPVPACPDQYSVRLLGDFDLTRVPTKEVRGVKVGYARVIGTWQADGGPTRSIQVESQGEQVPPPVPPEEKLPCATPPGGWPRQSSNMHSESVTRFLEARKAQVTGPKVFYPNGASRRQPVVFAIGVAHGDPKAFQREFEQVYKGNLCVYPVKLSRGDVDRIQAALQKVHERELGVYGSFGGDNAVTVTALVLDEPLLAALRPIGLGGLEVLPQVRPAG